MRVVAGEFRGRPILAPPGDTTRPTTDRVREAVYSAMASVAGSDLGGGAVLDAFAGSGALGIEALSRGCSSATFIDSDRRAIAALRRNIETLGIGTRARIIAGDAVALARMAAIPGGPFSLLLLDPPYRLAVSDVTMLTSVVAEKGLLTEGALVLFEHAAGTQPAWPDAFALHARKRYGSTEIDIAVYEGGPGSS